MSTWNGYPIAGTSNDIDLRPTKVRRDEMAAEAERREVLAATPINPVPAEVNVSHVAATLRPHTGYQPDWVLGTRWCPAAVTAAHDGLAAANAALRDAHEAVVDARDDVRDTKEDASILIRQGKVQDPKALSKATAAHVAAGAEHEKLQRAARVAAVKLARAFCDHADEIQAARAEFEVEALREVVQLGRAFAAAVKRIETSEQWIVAGRNVRESIVATKPSDYFARVVGQVEALEREITND